MAIDTASATRLIAKRGVAPPEGIVPGTPEYGQWAVMWLQGAVDAGDPEAITAAGGGKTEWGQEGAIIGAETAAPSSEWLGKRKPTPAELKRYYAETGKSEDFARFSAAQVAKWINDKWDVAGGYFTNDYGDIVEKPTESGPKSTAAGAATGESSAGRGGGGGGGVGAGGAGAGAGGFLGGPTRVKGLGGSTLTSPGTTGSTPEEIRLADLQRVLEDKFLGRQGMFGFESGRQGVGGVTTGPLAAQSLKGGGLWWGPGTEKKGWKDTIFDVAKKGQGPAGAPKSPMPTIPGPGVTPPPTDLRSNPMIAPPVGGPTPVAGDQLAQALWRKKRSRAMPSWYTSATQSTAPAAGGAYA